MSNPESQPWGVAPVTQANADPDLSDLAAFASGFPHGIFEHLREDRPVYWQDPTKHTPDGEGFWSLTTYSHIKWAATQHELLSSEGAGARSGGGTILQDMPRGLVAGVMFNMMDDPRHRDIRLAVQPTVSPRALRELESDLSARASSIVDAALDKGSCDFLVDVAVELPMQAMAGLLGVPQQDRHKLVDWADEILDFEGRDLGEQTDEVSQAAAALFEYGSNLLADKRGCPAKDMLSVVAAGRLRDGADPESMTDLEQQMFFSLLVAAGSDTTRNAIAGGMLALIEHPHVWEELRRDRSLLPQAIEEILRFSSPVPYDRRTATAPIDIGGRTIAAGDKVVLWWASANWDGAVFANPHCMDIRRDPNPHLAFGHGSHFCLGANLARMEIRLVFDALLDRVGSVELIGRPEWIRSNKHTGIRRMPVHLNPA